MLEKMKRIENSNNFISFQVCVWSISVQGQKLSFGHRSSDKHAIWFDTEEYCDDSYYDKDRDPQWRPISATSRQS